MLIELKHDRFNDFCRRYNQLCIHDFAFKINGCILRNGNDIKTKYYDSELMTYFRCGFNCFEKADNLSILYVVFLIGCFLSKYDEKSVFYPCGELDVYIINGLCYINVKNVLIDVTDFDYITIKDDFIIDKSDEKVVHFVVKFCHDDIFYQRVFETLVYFLEYDKYYSLDFLINVLKTSMKKFYSVWETRYFNESDMWNVFFA